mgnify:CR=1 FL=1
MRFQGWKTGCLTLADGSEVELPISEFIAPSESTDDPFPTQPFLFTGSLLIEVSDGPPLEIIEQNYEYDLMSREKILEKYVGRSLAWIQEDGERVSGRLLGMAAGPV